MKEKEAEMVVNNNDVKIKKSKKKYLKDLFTIKTEMIPVKLMFLFWGGLVAVFQPYLNSFFVCAGLSALKAGTATAFLFIPSLIVGPLWGVLADCSGRRCLIMLILCFGSAFSIGSLPFLSKAIAVPTTNSDVANQSLALQVSTTAIPWTDISEPITSNFSKPLVQMSQIHAYPGFEIIDDKKDEKDDSKYCPPITQDSASTLFYTFLIATSISSVFVIVLPFYMESIAMPLITHYSDDVSYGGQRIFGSIGCTIAFYFAGFVAQKCQFARMPKYSVAFFLYIPFVIIMIPLGIYMIKQLRGCAKKTEEALVPGNNNNKGKCNETSILRQILMFCIRFDVLFYLISVLVCGIGFNIFIYLTVLLVENQMVISKSQVGMIFAFNSISESVFFLLSGKIKEIFGSTLPTMAIGLFFYCVRYIVMSYTKDYAVMLAIQVLGGASFSVSWAAALTHVESISPAPIKTSMFLIVQTIHFGICALIVNIGGMNLYSVYGGPAVFLGSAILSGVWSVFMMIYHGYVYFTSRDDVSNGSSLDERLLQKRDNDKNINFTQDDFNSAKTSDI